MKRPRQKRKMPHFGSGAIQGFHFTEDQWRAFETKLHMPLNSVQREQLRLAAIDFRLDWSTEVHWPDIDLTLQKQKEVEKAANLLLKVALLPEEHGLVSILASSGVTKRDINRLMRLHRHLAQLHIKTQKYRVLLTDLATEAREKAETLLHESLEAKRGPKDWRPKYRLLIRLKQILYPDKPSLPIGTKLRDPEVDGPRGGSSLHTSRFADFLTAYLEQIPESQFKPTLQKAGEMIKKFNAKYHRRQSEGISESRF